MPISSLEGKHVAIMGFGAEGRAALRWLTTHLQRYRITLLEESSAENPKLAAAANSNPNIELLTGDSAFSHLEQYDCIIKSPGISPYRDDIAQSIEKGANITSGTQLWCDAHKSDRVIVVTGTKGKSTTTSLIAHLLNAAGHPTELLGNIGKPALERYDPDVGTEFFVMELSSYQTTGLRCTAEIAVLLNLYPEHTDWHGSTQQYFRDKTGFLHAPAIGKVMIDQAAANIPAEIRALKNLSLLNQAEEIHVEGNGVCDASKRLIQLDELQLRGTHNLQNIVAALSVIRALGIDIEEVLPALKTFSGLPHRLASLGSINGVEYIDDSISTTPESAMAALRSFAGRTCTQLLGGYDRDLDWHDFARQSRNTTLKQVITLPGNGQQIARLLRQENPELAVYESADMEDAVNMARESTPAGGVVILSPGAPSYGSYRNYKERGKLFARYAGFAPDSGP